MKTLIPYIAELLFLLVIYLIAKWQAYRFDIQQKTINHLVFAFVFAAIASIAGFYYHWKNIWLLLALLDEHLLFFAPLLNVIRKYKKPFFYIHSSGKKGSLYDLIFQKYMKIYPYFWWTCFALFIILQFKIKT